MEKKPQILLVHGGMTFKSEKDYLHYLETREVSTVKKLYWEADLEHKLDKTFEIIRPRMPLSDNARYRDWKILFERYVPHLRKNTIFIGSSLGGIFLAKYLSENELPKKALSVFLVCAPFDGTLTGEDLVGGFKLGTDLSLIKKNAKHIHILFSKDDEVVPASHAEKYRKKLPDADIKIYDGKNGHFKVSTFPEILQLIRQDTKVAPRRTLAIGRK